MNVMFLNTCVNLYQRNILVDLQKNLLKKGKKWDLYDKDDYKECQNAIVFGSTKKHTSKLWKIQNKSQRLKNEIERTHNTLTTDKKLIVFETPILGRKITDEHTHYRVGLDHFLPKLADFKWQADDKRYQVLKKQIDLNLKPWREKHKSKNVLILCQNPSDASLLGLDIKQWVMATVKHLMKVTKRKIVIRNHPLAKASITEMFELMYNIKQVEISENSLEKDLASAHCAVSYTSGASIDAMMNGIPVITPSPYNFVYGISSHDLENVENPILGDRLSLLYKLSYTQWSVEEIIEGKPLKHLL